MNAIEWYPIASLLGSVNSAVREVGLSPDDVINLGGNAVYCWMLYHFGPNSVTSFRGTHDLDFLISDDGKFDYVLDSLRDTGKVRSYEKRSSPGLEDKVTYEVIAPAFLGFTMGLGVDVYMPSSTGARLNRRHLYRDVVIREAPVDLGFATVPSLFDIFLMKMDICLDSHSGLRDKDRSDIATLAVIRGDSFSEFVQRMIDDSSYSGESTSDICMKLNELYKLFRELTAQNSFYEPIFEEVKQKRANYHK